MRRKDCPECWARAAAALRDAREASGRSLDDVAARTRIASWHLTAIEESRFDALPAPVFALGFTRSYARELGLAEGPLVQAIRDGLAPASVAAQPGTGPIWTATSGALLFALLALLVLVVA